MRLRKDYYASPAWDTPEHQAQRAAWAHEQAAREKAARGAQADSREYVGKPSEVRMAMEADGYDADQIAGHIRMARYDEATQFIRVTC